MWLLKREVLWQAVTPLAGSVSHHSLSKSGCFLLPGLEKSHSDSRELQGKLIGTFLPSPDPSLGVNLDTLVHGISASLV